MADRRSLEDQLEDLDGLDLRDLVEPRALSLEARRLRALERLLGAVALRLGAALRRAHDAGEPEPSSAEEIAELVYDWVCLASAMDHVRVEMGGPPPS